MEEQNRRSVAVITCIAPPASDIAAEETSSTTEQHRVSLFIE